MVAVEEAHRVEDRREAVSAAARQKLGKRRQVFGTDNFPWEDTVSEVGGRCCLSAIQNGEPEKEEEGLRHIKKPF